MNEPTTILVPIEITEEDHKVALLFMWNALD